LLLGGGSQLFRTSLRALCLLVAPELGQGVGPAVVRLRSVNRYRDLHADEVGLLTFG
jgi:hypothetical protein